MFAYQWTSVVPDITVVAKPLAAGLPLGCMLARGPIASSFTPGLHGTTFGGGPLACRAALEFLSVLEDERLLEHIQQTGSELREGLRGLMKRHASVRAVRGRGLMLALDLDRASKPVVNAARERGLLVNSTHDTVVRLLPPYIINSEHVREALATLDALLT
jgi:acetylornithine/succinyldiaminopimelate/putrescine aminotransferase